MRENERLKPRKFLMGLAALVMLCLTACAGGVTVPQVRRPPLSSNEADSEMAYLCQLTDDENNPCRPTQVTVRVCNPEEDLGCRVRNGMYKLLRELDVYIDYIDELNKE